MKPSSFVVSIDLEMNQLDTPKIIEIGLTIGDLSTKKVVEKKSILVNPEQNITEYITALTGITDYMVSNAPNIQMANEEMLKYLAAFNVHAQPVVWGGGDIWQLKKEIKDLNHFPFGYTEMNVKTIVQFLLISNGKSSQGGLAKSMSKFGLKFSGRKHRADDDSYNTLVFYFHLLNSVKFNGGAK